MWVLVCVLFVCLLDYLLVICRLGVCLLLGFAILVFVCVTWTVISSYLNGGLLFTGCGLLETSFSWWCY